MRVSRGLIATITIAAGVIFVVTLVRAVYWAPSGEVAAPQLEQAAPAREVTPGDLPKRLRIPALEVNAYVRHVGVNAQGNMATPGNFTDVGWYKYGTVPGFRGSAVVDGHVDNALALNGVFKRLGELKVGDSVYVDTASSTPLHFVVTEVVSYLTQDVPSERLFNAKDGTMLNLITCDGVWVKDQKQYDRRLVVYTKLVP